VGVSDLSRLIKTPSHFFSLSSIQLITQDLPQNFELDKSVQEKCIETKSKRWLNSAENKSPIDTKPNKSSLEEAATMQSR
jgi:hypothetical protein